MATSFKWSAAFTSQGNVLSTELNALAANAFTNAGTEVANQTNLDQWGVLRLSVDFVSAPTAGDYVNVYMLNALDGTNYPQGSSSVNPGIQSLVCSIPLQATSAAQVIDSILIPLLPGKTKFILENKSAQAFPATGSTLVLYSCDDGSV